MTAAESVSRLNTAAEHVCETVARGAQVSAKETTRDLYRRLRNRYGGNGNVLLCGVGNGAGFGNDGWADAIAMQTWPSKGLRVIGFEVKASRSDWLKELDKPSKNAEWQEACHEWYDAQERDRLHELAESGKRMWEAFRDALNKADGDSTGTTHEKLAGVIQERDNARAELETSEAKMEEAKRFRDSAEATVDRLSAELEKVKRELKVANSWAEGMAAKSDELRAESEAKDETIRGLREALELIATDPFPGSSWCSHCRGWTPGFWNRLGRTATCPNCRTVRAETSSLFYRKRAREALRGATGEKR